MITNPKMEEQCKLGDLIADYCDKNPVKVYGDYQDTLPDELINLCLTGDRELIHDFMNDYECELSDYNYELVKYHYNEMLEHFELDDSELHWDLFCDSYWIDWSDLWDSAFSNTNVRVTITLLDINDNPIEFPHHDFDNDYNEELSDYLLKTLGIKNPEKMESTYSCEILKLCTELNLGDLREHGFKLPDFITIRPEHSNYLLTHDLVNGSGSWGSIKVTKPYKFKYRITNDESSSYGVQGVYGFTSNFWNNNVDIWSE